MVRRSLRLGRETPADGVLLPLSADTVIEVPQGRFELRRLHHDDNEPLRAWDAADEYALAHIDELGVAGEGWLVVNDGFGALGTALSAHRPQSWTDSRVSMLATEKNLILNDVDPAAVTSVPSTSEPDGPIDVAIVKIPRTLALLDDQLRRLRPLLHERSVVVGAGMTRDVHTSTIDAFERHIGPTPTTRARKKARLLLAEFDPSLDPAEPPEPSTWVTPEGVVVHDEPNVFSAGRLDLGTRLLLDHLPAIEAGATVVDLGCGNGVVGATVATRSPDVDLVCCDESFQAVHAARATVGGVTDRATFHVTDVLDGVAGRSADVVLLNAPFHAGGARTTALPRRMFAETARVLRDGGQLRVVANRHLRYDTMLTRWFGSVAIAGSDPKFVVHRATEPRRDG